MYKAPIKTRVTGVYSHLPGAHRASGETLVVSLHVLLGEAIIPPLHHHHLTARVRSRGVELAARPGAASDHAEPALRPVHAHDCARASHLKWRSFKSEPEVRCAAPDEPAVKNLRAQLR